jgi:hypothetical protein
MHSTTHIFSEWVQCDLAYVVIFHVYLCTDTIALMQIRPIAVKLITLHVVWNYFPLYAQFIKHNPYENLFQT